MKLHTLAAGAALSLMFALPALADGKISATLASPVAGKTKVIAAGAVFACEGSECVSTAAPSRALTAAGCKALAKEVGRVSAYAGDRKSLEAAELDRCNVGQAPAATQTAAN